MKNLFKIFVILFFILTGWNVPQAQSQFFSFENELVGQKAPDFTLPVLSGKKINFTQYRNGKKAILFFWATWCPHCRRQLQELNTVMSQYEKDGIKILAIDLGEEKDLVSRYVTKYKIDVEMVMDQDSILEESYKLIGVPTFIFVDEKGMITAVRHSLKEE